MTLLKYIFGAILAITPLLAQVQYADVAKRIIRGNGVPASGNCANLSAVGSKYQNYAAAGLEYTCQQTSAGVFGWVATGTGGGGTTYTAGLSGGITITGSVIDIDTAYVPGKDSTSVITGPWTFATIGTTTNCSSSGGTCSAASAGSFTIEAAATTRTVATTRVSANSQILVMFDSSLGSKLSVTCNTTYAAPYVTTRTAATSFVVTIAAAPTTNPACYSYLIIN